MPKSADAFRTISEVAEWLVTPAHVLRFWESKFTQVKPVKRAGGRRYYRPADMQLLGGIKKLLHDDGMTIKGVQKVLREQGVKHVVGLSQHLDEVTELEASEMALDVPQADEASESGKVLNFQRDDDSADASGADPEKAEAAKPETPPSPDKKASPDDSSKPKEDAAKQDAGPAIPSFSHRRDPAADKADAQQAPTAKPDTPSAPTKTAAPAPAQVDVPPDPEDGLPADPGVLSALASHKGGLTADVARQLGELADRLRSTSPDHRS